MNSINVFKDALRHNLVRDDQVRLTVAKSRSPVRGFYVSLDLEYRHMGHEMSLFGTDKVNALLVALPNSASGVYDAFVTNFWDGPGNLGDKDLAIRMLEHPHAVCIHRDDQILRRSSMDEHLDLMTIPVTLLGEQSQVGIDMLNFSRFLKEKHDYHEVGQAANKVHASWRRYLGRGNAEVILSM